MSTLPKSQTPEYRKVKNREYYNRRRKGVFIFCEACNKSLSIGYYKRHLKTLSHLLHTKCMIIDDEHDKTT